MKKMMLLMLSSLFCMASCNNESTSSALIENANDKIEMYIEREPNDISISDAKKIAALFNGSGTAKTRSLDNVDVQVVLDVATNAPLLYIVNYGQNNGYVIISASKNTSPILAFSNTGHFSLDKENPSGIFVSEFKEYIKQAQLCKSDSLRIKYALQWASFEKSEPIAVTRALPSDIQQMKDKEIAYRESQGYKYIGGIAAASNYMSSDEYISFKREMESCSDPQYDYMETVQLFVKAVTQETIGELLQTQWHQHKPFNVDAPNGLAGCVPIAVAQIAYYHKSPNKYNWNEISVNPVQNNAFTYFIKDIRNLCEVSYDSNGTSSNYLKAKDALTKLGYTIGVEKTITSDKLRTQVAKYGPAYMRGSNSDGEGHAWVCDGYKNIRNLCVATLIKNPNDKRFKVVKMSPNGFMEYELFLDDYPSTAGEYFHMNFGWAGDSDGWYNRYIRMSSPREEFKYDKVMLTVRK